KDTVREQSADTVMLYTTIVHAVPAFLERLGLKAAPRVSNVLISNPFGLEDERYLMGARVELVLPVSVVAAGQMLNITAVTLAGKLQIGFLAMPQAVPSVPALAAYTVDAFDQLAQTMRAKTAQHSRGNARRRGSPLPIANHSRSAKARRISA